MIYSSMTNSSIAQELGKRVKSLRLRKNQTQREVANATGLSLKAIQNGEKGESKLLTYIKILRALNSLEALDNFLPEITISPLQLAKNRGKQRKRASGSRRVGIRNSKGSRKN